MKKIIVFIILACCCFTAKSQCTLPYKPLSAFGKDTTAFIMYNFRDRGACYQGKTLKEVTADLQIPIKDFIISRSMVNAQNTIGLYIEIYPRNVSQRFRDNNREANNIEIIWEKETKIDDDMRMERMYAKNGWTPQAYDYYKNMKIKTIRAVVYDYSRFYSKYYSADEFKGEL